MIFKTGSWNRFFYFLGSFVVCLVVIFGSEILIDYFNLSGRLLGQVLSEHLSGIVFVPSIIKAPHFSPFLSER